MKYFFLLLFFVSAFANAQINADWSEQVGAGRTVLKTIIRDQNSFYEVSDNGGVSDIRIALFVNGQKTRENTFTTTIHKKISRVEEVLLLNHYLYIFFSEEFDKGNRLYVQQMDENCENYGEPLLLKEQLVTTSFNSKSINYRIRVSPNWKFVSISYLYNNNNVLERPELVTTLYSENMVSKKETRIKMDYYLSEMGIDNISVSDAGMALILISGLDRPAPVRNVFNSLELYRIDVKGNVKHDILSKKQYNFFDQNIFQNNDSVYSIAFMYNEIVRKRKLTPGAKGVFVYNYYPQKDSLSQPEKLAFQDTALVKFLSDRELKKYKKAQQKDKRYDLSLQLYRLKDLFTDNEGGRTLVLEESWSVIQSYNTGRFYESYTIYNNNYLLLTRFDAQLKSNYLSIIPKVQISRDDGGYFNSFVSYRPTEDQLNILFNDNLANYDENGKFILNKSGVPYMFNNGTRKYCSAFVQFNLKDGKYTRHPLADQVDVNNLIVPQLFDYSNAIRSALISFTRRNNYQFVQIKW